MTLLYVEHPKIYDGNPPGTLHHAPAVIPDGSLQKFLELPIDVFAEICASFEPLDLWNTSISGRAFWDTLTSPDLGFIWAAARLRLYGSMPAPPEDMSEPQYTRFLLTDKCYTCDSSATEIDYSIKIKSCPTCFEKHYITLEEATLLFPGLPVIHLRAFQGGSNLWYQKLHYYKIAILAEFSLYVDHISKGGSAAEFEAGLEQRCYLTGESGRAVKKWMDKENARQQAKLEKRYKKRKKSIVARMTELGHSERDVDCSAAESLGLLRLPYNVTDEEWAAMRSALENDATHSKKTRSFRTLGYRACFRWESESDSDSDSD